MAVRVIVWTLGVVLGVIAVVTTSTCIELVTGYRIVDFIPWETNAESQRLYRARLGQLAMVSAAGCLASFMFAFYRRARQHRAGRARGGPDAGPQAALPHESVGSARRQQMS